MPPTEETNKFKDLNEEEVAAAGNLLNVPSFHLYSAYVFITRKHIF